MPEDVKNRIRSTGLYALLRIEGKTEEDILAAVEISPVLPRFLLTLGSAMKPSQMDFRDFGMIREWIIPAVQS